MGKEIVTQLQETQRVPNRINPRRNTPMKRQRLAEWIQKQTHLKPRETYSLKVKGWKKIIHANEDQKKAGVAVLISDKMTLK